MKIQVSPQVLLAVAIVLLAVNLVVMLTVVGAAPAHAEGRTCVGVALGENQGDVVRLWSDGSADILKIRPDGTPLDTWQSLSQ